VSELKLYFLLSTQNRSEMILKPILAATHSRTKDIRYPGYVK